MSSDEQTKRDSKRLSLELAKSARRCANRKELWDHIAKEILEGKIKGIDPRVHLRSPKAPNKIASDIHTLIGDGTPFSKVKPKIRVVYLELVKVVMEGLDIGRI